MAAFGISAGAGANHFWGSAKAYLGLCPESRKINALINPGAIPKIFAHSIQQIVSRAVVSTEIIDILGAAGIKSPDISILSDEFLAELKDMDKKNLALEALRKLLNGEIKSTGKTNVVQSRAFSERLEDAITRYHNNALFVNWTH